MNKMNNDESWKTIEIQSDITPDLSDNARVVLEKRYLVKDDEGRISENPADLFRRVAAFVASADLLYGKTNEEITETARNFYEMMARLEFVPNSPTLMNAGRPLGQLSACFVLPVEDSMEGIFDSVKNMALIHKSGGGTGFSFSRLRPKNDVVRTTAGISSGPVSFMKIFNAATETVKQGGTRRGANMAIMEIDHPDIIDFITAKENLSELTNFNISVALTDEFMRAVEEDRNYDLRNPRTGEKAGEHNAREVFETIVRMAWQSGEPGIVFLDRINEKHPLKDLERIESTNPCGEQPLLPWESCNLGSINLNRILIDQEEDPARIDYDRLRELTRKSVHFLDNVIDMNAYPLEDIREKTLANRKIGLGVMGFADLLIRCGIPYNSSRATDTAGEIMSVMQEESKKASRKLAVERGAFPNFGASVYAARKEEPIRNATTTTIAPTGTISIIANCSSGIEPIFALAYVRNVMDNDILVESNALFEETARKEGFYSKEMMEDVAEKGSAAGLESVPEEFRNVFVTAHDITPEWHIRIQAAFQKYVDNAVSKTVNFPREATREQIEEVYRLAWELECKGVTVYRDGSRQGQVLSVKEEKAEEEKPECEEPKRARGEGDIRPRSRDDVTRGSTRKMTTGCGSLYVTINEDSGGLFEVFATMGKAGGCAASQNEAVSRLISLALRSGLDRMSIVKQLKGVRCPNQAWERGGRILSCADAIAKAIERYGGVTREMMDPGEADDPAHRGETNGKGNDYVMVGVCPECHGPLEFEGGCSVCRGCGFSRCG